MRPAHAVLAVFGVLGSTPAGAVSLLVEGTASKQVTSLSVMGELELIKDRTFLTGCVGSTRTEPLAITTGADPETVSLPRSTQLCLGLDHGFNDHWRVSLMASASPRVTSQLQVLARPSVVYRSQTGSAGGQLGVSYESAGLLDDVQWGLDFGIAGTGYDLSHQWISAFRTVRYPAMLASLRPSAGVVLMLGDTELQLRGSYTAWSKDPLTAGVLTVEEVQGALKQVLPDATLLGKLLALNLDFSSFLQFAGTRLMAMDAISGLATAPVRFELRPAVQRRFTSWLRGQVGYTYDLYVPGAGHAHVASTRWTVSVGDHFQTWVAAAAQWDVPADVPPALYGILTLGVEVSF